MTDFAECVEYLNVVLFMNGGASVLNYLNTPRSRISEGLQYHIIQTNI